MDAVRFDLLVRRWSRSLPRRSVAAALVATLTGSKLEAKGRNNGDRLAPPREVAEAPGVAGGRDGRGGEAATCSANGAKCRRAADCCSRKCAGQKGRKRCKPCSVAACTAATDACAGPLCGCNRNQDCACWTDRDGSTFCGSLVYGACVPCADDDACASLFGVDGSRCIQADGGSCGCVTQGNPDGTACVAPCGHTCVPDGMGCETDGDCCSEVCGCVEGSSQCFCRAATCAEPNRACRQTEYWTDCCAGRCAGRGGRGVCAGGGCAAPDESCADGLDCCNGTCRRIGGTFRCCQPPGDACGADAHCCAHGDLPPRCVDDRCCTPPGKSCSGDRECCAGACEGGVCQTPLGVACIETKECSGWQSGDVRCFGSHVVEDGGVVFHGRCAVPPGGVCTTPETCGGDECRDGHCCLQVVGSDGGTCQDDDQCCDGVCGPHRFCCMPLGGACSEPNECCVSRPCQDGRCCIPRHEGCRADAECCGDLVCSGGACCSGVGHACDATTPCCTNFGCDRDAGVCVTCLEVGKACGFSTECCEDNVCDREKGCVTCLAEGALCRQWAAEECCDGLTCSGENNRCVPTGSSG